MKYPMYSARMRSFREVLDRWPTRAAVAEDCGVPYVNAQMWAYRNSVPSEQFIKLCAGAQRRGFEGITLELLLSLEAAKSAGEAA